MKIIIAWCILFYSSILSAQNLVDNEKALSLAKRSMEHMYNMNHSESEKYALALEKALPGHPAYPFLRALNLYWKAMPINNESDEFEDFHQYLAETLIRANKVLDKDKKNPEGIFFALAAHGYLAQFYAEEKSSFKAIKEARSAYSYMKEGFGLVSSNPEFYYTTGLYNYYREQYPESNPGYKPFMWFFANGDREKGLQQLELASKEAVFTRVEAINYSAHIYLRYEAAPSLAYKYAEKLVKLFPENHLYRAIYSETLLGMGRYYDMEPHIAHLQSAPSSFFKMIGNVYKGMWMEKGEGQLQIAKETYFFAIECSKEIPIKVDHYLSMAYCGLGRISIAEGDKAKAKEYFKKASSLAHYPSVKKEVEDFLKKT